MDLTSPLSVCYLSAVKLFARPQGFPNYNGQNNEAWVLAERHGKRTHRHTPSTTHRHTQTHIQQHTQTHIQQHTLTHTQHHTQTHTQQHTQTHSVSHTH